MPLEEKAKIVLKQSKDVKGETEMLDAPQTVVSTTEETLPNAEESKQIIEDKEEETETKQDEGMSQTEVVKLEILTSIDEKITGVVDVQKELELKIFQTLKENANFQIQVRQNMQKELEDAKKKLSGDIFIPLLKEVAELYVEWQDVLFDLEEGVTKRKVAGVFEVLQEILEEYGCEFGTSQINSKRRPKYSKLKNKVLTGIKEKHETVAKSHNSWIVKEPFVLYPEYVDVYVYDATLKEENNETDEENKINIQEDN